MKKSHFILCVLMLLVAGGYGCRTKKQAGMQQYGGIYTFGDAGKDSETRSGIIYLYPETDTTVLFYLFVTRGAPSYNSGSIDGRLTVRDGKAIFRKRLAHQQKDCLLRFEFKENMLTVTQDEDDCGCSFGNGVFIHDTFQRTVSEVPQYYTNIANEKVYFDQWKEEQIIELDELLVPRLLENPDTVTDIQILLQAGYRGKIRADFEPMLSEEWYDFYMDSISKKYFLERAEIEIGKYYDGCIGDSTTCVGSRRESIIMIKGIIPQNEAISSVALKKRRVWPEEKYSFTFNGKTYTLRGAGVATTTGQEEEKWGEVKNYKLYLSDPETEQLIVAIPSFNNTFVEIVWIGDLDRDGKPDFVLNTSRDYESKRVLLFLSSKAEEGEIVTAVAQSGYEFDC